MGVEPDQRAEQAPALCRACGRCRHGYRFDVQAPGAAQGAVGRGVELDIAKVVMPALVAGIHVLLLTDQGVDGRAQTSIRSLGKCRLLCPAMTQGETDDD